VQKLSKTGLGLYNSRIFQAYLDYIRATYPGLSAQEVLDHAGIAAHEVTDTGHWFTQEDADRFHLAVVEKTGDPDISRNSGRFSASSKGMALFKQYVVGLITTETAFLAMAHLYPLFSRGATIQVKNRARGVTEIISTPAPGVEEKPYQCDNRLGTLEALPTLFTHQYATIQHSSCFHKGDDACRYIVSWRTPASFKMKLVRNYTLLCSAIGAAGALFLMPAGSFMPILMLLAGLNAAAWIIHARLKIEELETIIETGHNTAQARIENANRRYNNSLLIQEIGAATAAILNVDTLMHRLADLMHERLDFNRGLILLGDDTGRYLKYSASYGYAEDEIAALQAVDFNVGAPDAKGYPARAFAEQKPLVALQSADLFDPVDEENAQSVRVVGVQSLLCVPLVYKDISLGILALDNIGSENHLNKSDVNLLQGIAAQIAISINNARSFQKLQQSEEKYRQTLESINEGFFETDLDANIRFANKAMSRLLGRTPEQIAHRRLYGFFSSGNQSRLTSLFANLRQSQEPVSFSQFEIIDANGNTIPVDLSVSLIMGPDLTAVGFRGILRDATERLLLENKHKQLENRVRQMQKLEAIGLLAGGIAHNFNNWLSGILGNATLIRMNAGQNAQVIDKAFKIESIVEKAAKMNQQLLSYARGGNYEIKPIALNKVLQEFADTFAQTRKEIQTTLSLDPDLPNVRGDKNQIEQVFWNLYINAIDAMPDGGALTIATRCTTSAALSGKPYEVMSGRYVMVSFSDTGTGIASEHLENIFDPFFTTKKGKGTGLGLASAYGIIKSHHGYIDVTSTPGNGTTFKIFLPSVKESPAPKKAPDACIHKGTGTILVVDDEQMVLETFVELLEPLGYTVVTAASGEEALQRHGNRLDRIDIAIIDMIMPGMNGRELYAHLKMRRPSIKTLLCSGYGMNEKIMEIMEQGCDGFIQKPFSLTQISEAIRKISSIG